MIRRGIYRVIFALLIVFLAGCTKQPEKVDRNDLTINESTEMNELTMATESYDDDYSELRDDEEVNDKEETFTVEKELKENIVETVSEPIDEEVATNDEETRLYDEDPVFSVAPPRD